MHVLWTLEVSVCSSPVWEGGWYTPVSSCWLIQGGSSVPRLISCPALLCDAQRLGLKFSFIAVDLSISFVQLQEFLIS